MIRPTRKANHYDVPVRTHSLGDLTIEGYSRAAYQTYWRIPELKIGFDFGANPLGFAKTDTWAVTHTHADHLAALPCYLARRDIMRMGPSRVLVPAQKRDEILALLEVWKRLQECDLPGEIIPCAPGDRIPLGKDRMIECLSTHHTVPSLGYVVWSLRHKLKATYAGLPGATIRELRRAGEDVHESVDVPLVAYLGDTVAEALDDNPVVYRARVLIMEATYLMDESGGKDDAARKYGHTHIRDITARCQKFQNECLILSHFSGRYSPGQIEELAAEQLPEPLARRTVLWI